MSSRARRAEKEREDEAAYLLETQRRAAKEAAFRSRFGDLETRLEELGIEVYVFQNYIREVAGG